MEDMEEICFRVQGCTGTFFNFNLTSSRVCSVSVPRNENKNKNNFDGQFRQLPNRAALSHNDCQPNLRASSHLPALCYTSSSTKNMAVAIITTCSICYKYYWS